MIHKKMGVLLIGMVLGMGLANADALDSHMALALDHAEATVKIADFKILAEQAEMAKSHIKVIEDHLKAGNSSLDAVIAHAKQDHVALANKSAEEAVLHLKAAQ